MISAPASALSPRSHLLLVSQRGWRPLCGAFAGGPGGPPPVGLVDLEHSLCPQSPSAGQPSALGTGPGPRGTQLAPLPPPALRPCPSPPTVFTPRVIGTAVARYNFAARDMRELSLREGDLVKIYSRIGGDQGWWKGEANGRVSRPFRAGCGQAGT